MAKRMKDAEDADAALRKKKPDTDGTLAKLVSWYEDSVTATFTARNLAERDRDYYDNKQWTRDEEDTLKKRGQAPIVINRVKPKIDFLLGTERKTRTDPHAFPRNPADEASSEAATDALRYVADCNDFDQVRSDAFENILIEGTGAALVEVDKKQKIKQTRIPWDRLFYDPHARQRDFADALYMGIVMWMDQSQVKTRWPDGGEDVWTACMDETATTYGDRPRSMWLDSNRTRIKVCEVYYLDGEDWMRAVYTKGGWLEKPAPSSYLDEDDVPVNPICAVSAHIDRENNRYGVVRQLIGPQDEINKRRSKALHLISTRQFKAERGAVDDLKKTKQELAKPDGIVEVNPGMEFELIDTSDMAQGNLVLLTEAKAEIDAVGANAALQGKQQGAQSGRAAQIDQQAGMVELGPVFDALHHWQRLIHRQTWYRIKQYWRAPMWVRVTDDEQSPKYVGLNQPTTEGDMLLEQLKSKKDPRAEQFAQVWEQVKSAPPEAQPQMLAQAEMPLELLRPTVQNEVAKMDMDIIIAEAPDTVNLQGEQFEGLMKMYEASLASQNPRDRIPFEVVIQASSLRGKSKILSMIRGEDDNPEAQQQQKEAAEFQKANAQADLMVKQADAQLKQAQAQKAQADAAKAMAEANMPPPGEPAQPAIPDALIKAQADIRKAEIDSETALRKTEIEQDNENLREGARIAASDEQASRAQATQAAEKESAQVEGVMQQLQEFVTGLQTAKADKADETSKVLVQGLTAAIQDLRKPRKVVRGSDGRVAGIE